METRVVKGFPDWHETIDDIIAEAGVYDLLKFLKQLGVIEYTEKAKKLFPEDIK